MASVRRLNKAAREASEAPSSFDVDKLHDSFARHDYKRHPVVQRFRHMKEEPRRLLALAQTNKHSG